jgi:hypothetical protein
LCSGPNGTSSIPFLLLADAGGVDEDEDVGQIGVAVGCPITQVGYIVTRGVVTGLEVIGVDSLFQLGQMKLDDHH